MGEIDINKNWMCSTSLGFLPRYKKAGNSTNAPGVFSGMQRSVCEKERITRSSSLKSLSLNSISRSKFSTCISNFNKEKCLKSASVTTIIARIDFLCSVLNVASLEKATANRYGTRCNTYLSYTAVFSVFIGVEMNILHSKLFARYAILYFQDDRAQVN